MFTSFRAKWQPKILSVMRIVVALLYLQYGLMKVFGFPVPGPASLSPLLMLAAAIETIGGLLLLIGLFTEAAAFITCGEMAVAYFLRYVKSVYPIATQGGSLTVLFCFVFFYLIFAGGGSWSLDSATAEVLKAPAGVNQLRPPPDRKFCGCVADLPQLRRLPTDAPLDRAGGRETCARNSTWGRIGVRPITQRASCTKSY